MPLEIAIVDFGAGNLRSVAKALETVGASARVTQDPSEILAAKGVILPGVGSSGSAMAALHERNLVEPLLEVAANGTPFLGVCLGLQLLLETSEEDPDPCLGIVRGGGKRFVTDLKVPHMGWNQVNLLREHPLFQGVPSDSYFYFVHSYYVVPTEESEILATTEYGINFCSVLARDNLIATQFHPEKSGPIGLRVYENFVKHMVAGSVTNLPQKDIS